MADVLLAAPDHLERVGDLFREGNCLLDLIGLDTAYEILDKMAEPETATEETDV